MKRLVIGLLMLLATVLMAGIVLAAFVFDRPDTDEYLKGTYTTINGTAWVGDSTNGNCTNVTADYRVSGGSTYTYIGANTSLDNITGDWLVKESFVTNGLSDDTTYSIRARCFNDSNGVVIATATEVQFKVDNGVPVCTMVYPLSSTSYKPTQAFEITGTNASSATLAFGNNNPESMTESTAGDTFTLTSVLGIPESTYDTVTGITSDGLNTTTCTSSYVKIDRDATVQVVTVGLSLAEASARKRAEADTGSQVTQQSNARRNTFLIIGLAVIAIVYFRKRK